MANSREPKAMQAANNPHWLWQCPQISQLIIIKDSQVFAPGASLGECTKHDDSNSGLEQQRLTHLSLMQPLEVQNKF